MPKTKSPDGLTAKQRAFVREYLVDLCATRAAKRAGYSGRTAKEQGYQLLGQPHVAAAIEAAQEARAERVEVDADRVVEEYARIAFAYLTDVVQIEGGSVTVTDTDKLSPAQRASIAEISQTKDTIRVKLHPKTTALEGLGKHLGMFVNRSEINANVAGGVDALFSPLALSQLTDSEYAALRGVIEFTSLDLNSLDCLSSATMCPLRQLPRFSLI